MNNFGIQYNVNVILILNESLIKNVQIILLNKGETKICFAFFRCII